MKHEISAGFPRSRSAAHLRTWRKGSWSARRELDPSDIAGWLRRKAGPRTPGHRGRHRGSEISLEWMDLSLATSFCLLKCCRNFSQTVSLIVQFEVVLSLIVFRKSVNLLEFKGINILSNTGEFRVRIKNWSLILRLMWCKKRKIFLFHGLMLYFYFIKNSIKPYWKKRKREA